MSLSVALLLVLAAGAVGGVVNALLTDNGFVLPREEVEGSVRVLRPGFVGNAVVGAVAAAVSWGLYGPLAARDLVVSGDVTVSAAALAGAVLVGLAGSRWLSAEVDKKLLRGAVRRVAPSEMAARIDSATPVQALRMMGEQSASTSETR